MTTKVRKLALPLLSAVIMGGAALGLAGVASAATDQSEMRPSVIAVPQDHAKAAPEAAAGSMWHRHHGSLHDSATAAELPHLAR